MELTEAMNVIEERLPVGWSFRIMDDLTYGNITALQGQKLKEQKTISVLEHLRVMAEFTEGRIWRWVILDIQGIPKVFRPNSVSPEKFENVEGAILNLASFLTSNRVC
jgi:hypothetical protein